MNETQKISLLDVTPDAHIQGAWNILKIPINQDSTPTVTKAWESPASCCFYVIATVDSWAKLPNPKFTVNPHFFKGAVPLFDNITAGLRYATAGLTEVKRSSGSDAAPQWLDVNASLRSPGEHQGFIVARLEFQPWEWAKMLTRGQIGQPEADSLLPHWTLKVSVPLVSSSHVRVSMAEFHLCWSRKRSMPIAEMIQNQARQNLAKRSTQIEAEMLKLNLQIVALNEEKTAVDEAIARG
jgi:hypothetical protein